MRRSVTIGLSTTVNKNNSLQIANGIVKYPGNPETAGDYGDGSRQKGVFNNAILPRDIQADNNVAFMTGSQHCFSFPPEELRGTIQLPPRHYIRFHYLRGIIVKHGSQHQVDGLVGRLIGETPWPIITQTWQTCNSGQKAQCNLTKLHFSFSIFKFIHFLKVSG